MYMYFAESSSWHVPGASVSSAAGFGEPSHPFILHPHGAASGPLSLCGQLVDNSQAASFY